MNINGKGIKRIITVIDFVLVEYVDRLRGTSLNKLRQQPGDGYNLLIDKKGLLNNYRVNEFYRNYTYNNIPITENDVVPEGGAIIKVDYIKVDISTIYAAIEFDVSHHYPLTNTEIRANRNVYFRIQNIGNYRFYLLIESESMDNGVHKYICSFMIEGMSSNPGQTYNFSPVLSIFSDSSCTNLIGQSYINLRVYHKTSGNED